MFLSVLPSPIDPLGASRDVGEAVAHLGGVTKRFGDVTALDEVTGAVPRGIVGLLGPNGAGKSTLIRVLLGLESAEEGSVTLLDLPVPRDAIEARARVGLMPEDDCLFPDLTGLDQVLHAAEVSGLDRVDALSRAHETLDLMRIGEERYRDASGFSRGMRQRLRLAMCLVHGPELVLLDEPTAGLDPSGRQEMLDLIKTVGEAGTSVLLSTHVLADVEAVCSHVLVLKEGSQVFVGPLEEFRGGDPKRALRRYVLRVRGDAGPLLRALESRAIECGVTGPRVHVRIGDDAALARIWDAVIEAGADVRELTPDLESMEEAFLRHVRPATGSRMSAGLSGEVRHG